MAAMNYEGVGQFIYGAHRHGGDLSDVAGWMANDLGVATPSADDSGAMGALYGAFFAKHTDPQVLAENHARFIEVVKQRHAQARGARPDQMQ